MTNLDLHKRIDLIENRLEALSKDVQLTGATVIEMKTMLTTVTKACSGVVKVLSISATIGAAWVGILKFFKKG